MLRGQRGLERASKETAAKISVLTQREEVEEQAVQADTQELARVRKLLANGTVTNPQMTESRRALMLSSSRRLETTVQLMQARRLVDEHNRQLERIANQRQSNLMLQLRDGNVRLADLSVKIQNLRTRLAGLGAISAKGGGVGSGQRAELVIVRKSGAEWRRLTVGEDVEVQPGDVIEVAYYGEPLPEFTALH